MIFAARDVKAIYGFGCLLAASILFALVHPLPTFPPIFFLSLCLGYVYERTGNLWASIFIHAIFNGSQIALTMLAT